jgi:cell division protein FtsQ
MKFARPAGVVAVIILLIAGYNALANSSLFDLSRVEVNDTSASLRAEIEQLVRHSVAHTTLLNVDLASIRQKVESLPRVRQATVARMLPDAISVHVVERKPSVLVRRESGGLVWLDDDAVELGEISTASPEAKSGGASEIPPIARGFSEGARSSAAAAEDRERIELYKQIRRELGEGEISLWNLVDEVDLTFPKNINIRLAASPVTVVVGGKDFRHRFDTALQILEAIKRGDQDALARYRVQEAERLIANADLINFMDASRPERIVLNFSGTEKPFRQEKALRQEAGSRSTPGPAAIARAPKKEQAKDSKKDPKKETRPRQTPAIKR